MQPLVSIVIPAYNAAFFIEETIESALKQSYGNIEIIVVDDGSTDASLTIAQRYVKDGVKVVTQINRGASSARNLGIILAKGQYIQFLDADDLLHPKKIEYQVETIKNFSDMHLIGGKWHRFDKDVNRPFKAMPYTDEETKCFSKEEWVMDRPYMIPHTWLVSKKLLSLAGLWDEKLSFNDDGEFFCRVVSASAGVVIDHRAAAYYRSGNTASLSNRRNREAMLSWIESVKSYKAVVHHLIGEKGNQAVDRYFYEVAYNCLNKYPDLVRVCKAEMYDPEKVYNLSDNLVFYLAKLIGWGRAKRVRELISYVREIAFMKFLISRTKAIVGWSSY